MSTIRTARLVRFFYRGASVPSGEVFERDLRLGEVELGEQRPIMGAGKKASASGGENSRGADVNTNYKCPPKQGQIYPPQPIEPVTAFGAA